MKSKVKVSSVLSFMQEWNDFCGDGFENLITNWKDTSLTRIIKSIILDHRKNALMLAYCSASLDQDKKTSDKFKIIIPLEEYNYNYVDSGIHRSLVIKKEFQKLKPRKIII